MIKTAVFDSKWMEKSWWKEQLVEIRGKQKKILLQYTLEILNLTVYCNAHFGLSYFCLKNEKP